MKYTYGRSKTAARRLEDVARFFNPLAGQFISEYVAGPIASALDLGCGPGFTTEMLADVLKDAKIYGMDNSAVFLEMAQRRCPRCLFVEHDVTQTPFPVQTEVMYVRFLLSHLRDVTDLVDRWVQQLLSEGTFFIDEVESADTDIPVFRRYLDINAALIESQGADLYVGKILANGRYGADVLCNHAVKLPVSNYLAATWFFPNTVTIWENETFITDSVAIDERNEISAELDRIIKLSDPRQDITWTMRRLVLKRR